MDITPARVHIGDTVDITGSGFGASQGTSILTVDGIEAEITYWSNTLIKIIVPEVTLTDNGYVDISLTVGSVTLAEENALWILLGGILRFVNPDNWEEVILDLDNGGEGSAGEIWQEQGTMIPLPSTEGTYAVPDSVDGNTLVFSRLPNKEIFLNLLITGETKKDLDEIMERLIIEIYKDTGCLEYRPEKSSVSLFYTYYRVSEAPETTDYFTHKLRGENYAYDVQIKLPCHAWAETEEEEIVVSHNLLANGSFENDLTGWEVVELEGGSSVDIDITRYVIGGSQSCQLTTTGIAGTAGILLKDFVEVDSSKIHNIQMFGWKQSGAGKISLLLRCYGVDDNLLEEITILDEQSPSAAAWEDLIVLYGEAIIYPEGSVSDTPCWPDDTTKIKIYVKQNGAAGVISVDDILLTESEYISDHLLESSFGVTIPPGVVKGHVPAPMDMYICAAQSPGAWSEQWVGYLDSIYGIDYSALDMVLACGAKGKIYYNDGASWALKTSGIMNNLYSIHKLDATHFWTVGQDGAVLFSSNGNTWTVQPFPAAPELFLPMGSMEYWSSVHNNAHWNFSGNYNATLDRSTDKHSGTYSARIKFPNAYAPAITDPSLETGTGGNWTYWAKTETGHSDITRDTQSKRSGQYGAHFNNNTNSWEDAYLTSTTYALINTNNNYQVKVWYLSTIPSPISLKGYLTALFYSSGGTYLGSKYISFTPNGNYNWHQVALALTASMIPSNATRMKLRIGFRGTVNSGGDIFVDDFSIITTSTAKATGALYTKTGYLKEIDIRKSYRASFWVKGYGGRWYYARAYFYNSSKTVLGYKTICPSQASTSSWLQKSAILSPNDYPIGTVYIGFYFYAEDTTSWAGRWVQFDDVSLKIATPADLKGVFSVASNNTIAVGKWGTIIKFAGATWTEKTSGVISNLNSITAIDATHWIAVGDNGVILTSTDGDTWTRRVNGLTTENLYGVSSLTGGHVWAVGANGLILYSSDNGVNWIKQNCPISNDLLAVTIVDATHVWSSGKNGALIVFNGTSWAIEGSGTSEDLNAISAFDSTHIYMGGSSGVVIWGINNSVTAMTMTDLVIGQRKEFHLDYNPVLDAVGSTLVKNPVGQYRRKSQYRAMAAEATEEWLYNIFKHKGTYLISIGGGISDDVNYDQIVITMRLKDMAGTSISPSVIATVPSSLDLSTASGYTAVDVFREIAFLNSKFAEIDIPCTYVSVLTKQAGINQSFLLTAPSGLTAGQTLNIDCLTLIPTDESYILLNNWRTGATGAQQAYLIISSTDNVILSSISKSIETATIFNPTYSSGSPEFKANPLGVNMTVMGCYKTGSTTTIDYHMNIRMSLVLKYHPRWLLAGTTE